MKQFFLFLIVSFISFPNLLAQDQKPAPRDKGKKLVQFSGVVVGSDSLHPIPFSSIMIKNSSRGTICDYYGYFSFVAQVLDTIEFQALGYKRNAYIIPDTLKDSRYSLIHILIKDTVTLPVIPVYPWPSRDQFKTAFLNNTISDDDLERARRNLANSAGKDVYESGVADPGMSYKYQMQQQYSRLYYAGQYPSISLLNPVAWAKFIKAWQNGDYKRKD